MGRSSSRSVQSVWRLALPIAGACLSNAHPGTEAIKTSNQCPKAILGTSTEPPILSAAPPQRQAAHCTTAISPKGSLQAPFRCLLVVLVDPGAWRSSGPPISIRRPIVALGLFLVIYGLLSALWMGSHMPKCYREQLRLGAGSPDLPRQVFGRSSV